MFNNQSLLIGGSRV